MSERKMKPAPGPEPIPEPEPEYAGDVIAIDKPEPCVLYGLLTEADRLELSRRWVGMEGWRIHPDCRREPQPAERGI